MPDHIAVIGVGADGAGLSAPAIAALGRAEVVFGGVRHLALARTGVRQVPIDGDIGAALDAIAAATGEVCVLSSGDPGFFGILRALRRRFPDARLAVHPAVSSVATAFARVGLPWDDARVVSAHGRPLADAASAVAGATKAAVLVSPEHSPEALGKALLALGAFERRVAVCVRLGTPDETVVETDLAGLAAGTWDPMSVVLLVSGDGTAMEPVLAWGRPEARFAHRAGMITKAEVRAVALGKLAVPATGVVWDVGSGSGSVAVEVASLSPDLEVYAIERDEADVRSIRANASAHGVCVHVVEGEAPRALAELPDPDRAFVGGGGLDVLDAVVARLLPEGVVVATYAALDRAAAAAQRLGQLVQVAVSRGTSLPGGGTRLAGENPVFVVWGPEP